MIKCRWTMCKNEAQHFYTTNNERPEAYCNNCNSIQSHDGTHAVTREQFIERVYAFYKSDLKGALINRFGYLTFDRMISMMMEVIDEIIVERTLKE